MRHALDGARRITTAAKVLKRTPIPVDALKSHAVGAEFEYGKTFAF